MIGDTSQGQNTFGYAPSSWDGNTGITGGFLAPNRIPRDFPPYGTDNGGGYGPQQNQQVGHDGTYNGMTREQYRDKWMSSGINDVAGQDNFLKQYGGTRLSGNGTVRTPYGDTLDMLIGARTNGQGRPGWTEVNGPVGNDLPSQGGFGGNMSGDMGGFGGGSFSDWLSNLVKQFQGPRAQDMPYKQLTGNRGFGTPNPISNYFMRDFRGNRGYNTTPANPQEGMAYLQ